MIPMIICALCMLGCFSLGIYLGRETKSNKEFKKKAVKCFDDVDWIAQVFTMSTLSDPMSNKYGETHFYRIGPIDEAIKKLNELKP